MKTSNKGVRKFPLAISKIMMALIFISLISVTFIEPVFGQHYRNRGRNEFYGEYRHSGRGYYHPGYRAPFYPPPPVIYDPYPYQSPGINLMFPIRIR